jgi:outer membrane protein
VNQAKVNQSIAELQLEQEKMGLRQRIELARVDAVAARDFYKANVEAVKSSQKSFEFAEVRFEAGAMNVTEFNTAKNNLQISQAQLSRSRYDFIFKTKILDFYMGKPLGFKG